MQDGYCATSLSFGNATSGTFGQPQEVLDLQQLLQVTTHCPCWLYRICSLQIACRHLHHTCL